MHEEAGGIASVGGAEAREDGSGLTFGTARGNPPDVDAGTGDEGVRELFEAQAEMVAEHAIIVPEGTLGKDDMMADGAVHEGGDGCDV